MSVNVSIALPRIRRWIGWFRVGGPPRSPTHPTAFSPSGIRFEAAWRGGFLESVGLVLHLRLFVDIAPRRPREYRREYGVGSARRF